MRVYGRSLLGVVLALLLVGCSTKRSLTIHSQPEGARVWVNGEEQGQTPVTIPFVYYGWFEVRLEKLGYEALARDVKVPTRIDGYPVIDLPFELVVRGRHFEWTGVLEPIPETDDDSLREILQGAEAFRARTLREAVPGAPPPLPEGPRQAAPLPSAPSPPRPQTVIGGTPTR